MFYCFTAHAKSAEATALHYSYSLRELQIVLLLHSTRYISLGYITYTLWPLCLWQALKLMEEHRNSVDPPVTDNDKEKEAWAQRKRFAALLDGHVDRYRGLLACCAFPLGLQCRLSAALPIPAPGLPAVPCRCVQASH